MTRPHLRFFAAAVLLGLGCSVFAVTLVRATVYAPAEPEAPAPKGQGLSRTQFSEQPARLRIPSLGVDAHVQDVGIAKSGRMAVPSNYTDVGWYRYGPAPGSVGSAVLDGHIDNGFGLGGVFRRLGELRPGDEILLETAGGEELRFVVEEASVYEVADVPVDRIFNRNDAARLNLITCEGVWDGESRSYSERLVVYAVLR